MDRRIAKLFGMETKVLNQAVKRNINRFNKSNYFQITKEEFELLKSQNSDWKSQIVTSNGDKMGLRKLPYVFTKEGLLILTSILKVDNSLILDIIDAFDKLKNESNFAISDAQDIRKCICEIRGKQVILDFDLARLYNCTNGTKEVNQAVKNNLEKFPERYCFQITKDEYENCSRSKILTLNVGRGHNLKYLPYAFTEEGVIMLATILHTSVAIDMSIKIIDTFVEMKKYVSYISLEQKYINNLVLEHDENIKLLNKTINEFKKNEVITDVYFDGQIYDAYSKILSIFKKAKKKLIIVDSYADNELLNIIKDITINVIVITTNKHMTNTLVNNYNMNYHNLKVVYDNTFHDRYFIVDSNVYHCGASINRIGYKTFFITKISDKVTKDAIVNKINNLI